MLFIKQSWCNAQVSIIIACTYMHDCTIDKTCIDRIIEHSTDCFHKEPFVESPVYEMPSFRVTEGDGLSETAVWPTLFLLNVSTALKGTHNYNFICCHCSWCCAVWHP